MARLLCSITTTQPPLLLKLFPTTSALCRRSCSSSNSFDNSVTYLRNSRNGAEVFLIGTSHISTKSSQDVAQLIKFIKPGTVAIELCKGRAASLGRKTSSISLKDFFKCPGDLGQKSLTFALSWLYEMMRKSGLEPGEEFRVAIQEGKQAGAEIAYIDEDMNVTMARVRKGISLKAIFSCMANMHDFRSRCPNVHKVTEMTDPNKILEVYLRTEAIKESIEFFGTYFPYAINALLHQRNELMVKRLREFEGKIVGVVGLAHVDGMHKLWRETES